MRQLTAQFPIAPWRVVYTASGNTLAAAIINDHLGIVEYKLYWAAVKSKEEAQYLTAILNTPILDRLVKPYQSTGAFGPRDFDKYLWAVRIPRFQPDSPKHRRLVDLAVEAEDVAQQVPLGEVRSFQIARGNIRKVLMAAGISSALDTAVNALLESS